MPQSAKKQHTMPVAPPRASDTKPSHSQTRRSPSSSRDVKPYSHRIPSSTPQQHQSLNTKSLPYSHPPQTQDIPHPPPPSHFPHGAQSFNVQPTAPIQAGVEPRPAAPHPSSTPAPGQPFSPQQMYSPAQMQAFHQRLEQMAHNAPGVDPNARFLAAMATSGRYSKGPPHNQQQYR